MQSEKSVERMFVIRDKKQLKQQQKYIEFDFDSYSRINRFRGSLVFFLLQKKNRE